MKTIIYSISILLLVFSLSISVKAQASIDLESGAVFTGKNNVRIPGNQGTLFCLKDDLISKTAFFYRIKLNYTIKSHHTISLLCAPPVTKSEGRVAQDVLLKE